MRCPSFAICPLLAIGLVLHVPCAFGQGTTDSSQKAQRQVAPTNLDQAIDRVQSGHYDDDDLRQVMNGGDEAREIPVLEKLFPTMQHDYQMKEIVAATLIRFKDPNDKYYNYLSGNVRAEVDSNVPESLPADEIPDASSSSTPLAVWARSHNYSVREAAKLADKLFVDIVAMHASEDPRFIPLLRRAVKSPNLIAAQFAVGGLAKLKDNDSIEDVLTEIKNSPDPGRRVALADQLRLFDNDQADAAAAPYLPKDRLEALNQRKVERHKLESDNTKEAH